eukprot:3644316-Amphidinium_carterae.1
MHSLTVVSVGMSCLRIGCLLITIVHQAYFQFDTDYVNFNHGGFGGTPKPVRAAMEARSADARVIAAMTLLPFIHK